jgi:hypothetical protein
LGKKTKHVDLDTLNLQRLLRYPNTRSRVIRQKTSQLRQDECGSLEHKKVWVSFLGASAKFEKRSGFRLTL